LFQHSTAALAMRARQSKEIVCMSAIGVPKRVSRLAMLLLALAPAAAARGQFKADEIDQSLRAHGRVLQRYAADPNSDPSKKPTFENYITKYYIPSMTQTDPMALGELSKLRTELFRLYVWPSAPAVQSWLNATLLERMQAIYKDSAYHPSVRYNALLVIGTLDEQYGESPKPLPAANTVLIGVLADGLRNASLSPAMMVGALIGLERHAKYRAGLPQQAQDTMAKGFMAVGGRDKFPQEMSTAVRNWIRMQAARGLAHYGTIGENAQYHQALMKMIDDASLGVENRCEIAGLLPKLQYKAGDAIDAPAAVKSLAQLVVDYGADEAKIAQKYVDVRVNPLGGGAFFTPGTGGTHKGFRIVKDQLVYERRRPVDCLSDLQAGLKAIQPALPEDQQKLFTELQQSMQPIVDIATKKDSLDLDIARDIQAMSEKFKQIAAAAVAKPAEAAGEEKPAEVVSQGVTQR
jgi:hypothetical protein